MLGIVACLLSWRRFDIDNISRRMVKVKNILACIVQGKVVKRLFPMKSLEGLLVHEYMVLEVDSRSCKKAIVSQ